MSGTASPQPLRPAQRQLRHHPATRPAGQRAASCPEASPSVHPIRALRRLQREQGPSSPPEVLESAPCAECSCGRDTPAGGAYRARHWLTHSRSRHVRMDRKRHLCPSPDPAEQRVEIARGAVARIPPCSGRRRTACTREASCLVSCGDISVRIGIRFGTNTKCQMHTINLG